MIGGDDDDGILGSEGYRPINSSSEIYMVMLYGSYHGIGLYQSLWIHF